ncbi:hypothetical protein LAZ67_X002230, partial [Cordylochernes scorpioides]
MLQNYLETILPAHTATRKTKLSTTFSSDVPLTTFIGSKHIFAPEDLQNIPKHKSAWRHLINWMSAATIRHELSHLSPLDIEQVLGIPEQGGLDNAPKVDDLTLSRILEAEFHFSSLEEKLDSFEADVFSLEEKLDSFEAYIIDILQKALQRHKTNRFFLQTEVELIKTNDAS